MRKLKELALLSGTSANLSISFQHSAALIQRINASAEVFLKKKRIDVERPHILKDYNQHMGGVDLCDMMLELYRTSIPSNKWYMRIVYYCLDQCFPNFFGLAPPWLPDKQINSQRPLASFLSEKNVRQRIFICNFAIFLPNSL